ncbi:MAG: transglycosylase SLT domain-containing protein [Halioglobus sp.]|nr:transglycosylase SLT domain-containing protein [Halioglobus sp.]
MIFKIINFNKLTAISTVVSLTFLAACQSAPGNRTHADSSVSPAPLSSTPVSTLVTNTPPDDVWERIRRELNWQEIDHTRVDKARARFLQQHNYVPAAQERANYYLHHIVEEVDSRDMPMEITLLPMIESNLNPFAVSHSGAGGLWQIMPRTGTHLGLTQDAWYDGRHALRDSTTGALDYLETLHERFDNDWLLALAAYNCGASTVSRAQRNNEAKGLDTDYWSLDLPLETRNYVPKLLAVVQIVANPEEFNVTIPTVDNAPAFEVVEIKQPMQLVKAAQLAGVDVNALRALNPGRLRGAISAQGTSELLLPIGTLDQFETGIAQAGPEALMRWETYQIQPGDSLGYIAAQFNTLVVVLQQLNSIEGTKIRAGDTLNVPIGVSRYSEAAVAQDYRVRKGDSLHRIADKFNISVSDIVTWNALDPEAYILPGQQLTLYAADG